MEAQPFFVLEDKAYDRILAKLNGGSRFEWSFSGACPHKKKSECRCQRFMNVLGKDRTIVRISEGKQKPVLRMSDFLSSPEGGALSFDIDYGLSTLTLTPSA